MCHLGSVIGEKRPNTVRIVGNNLNGLIPCHFRNNKMEPLKGVLRYLEADVGEIQEIHNKQKAVETGNGLY